MIALLTDFAWSEYVGILKGVIARLAPGCPVIDLCHTVTPAAVREGAWVLLSSFPYFPEGTVFLGVVDPGVGTGRQAVIVESRRYRWVGPDNGLLYPAAAQDGIRAVFALPVPWGASPTFHGRDIFAPAAARLARGEDPASLGEPTTLRVVLHFRCEGRWGEVVRIDPFGNVVTSLPPAHAAAYRLRLPGRDSLVVPCHRTFAEGPPGTLFVVVGSAGTLELVVREGSANSRLQLRPGDPLALEPVDAAPRGGFATWATQTS